MSLGLILNTEVNTSSLVLRTVRGEKSAVPKNIWYQQKAGYFSTQDLIID